MDLEELFKNEHAQELLANQILEECGPGILI